MRFTLVACALALFGCAPGRGAAEPSEVVAPRVAPTATTVTFAAYGGQGVMPADAPEGEYERVVLVLEVHAGQEGLSKVGVGGIELTDSRGKALATMREIISVKRLSRTPKSEGWEALSAQGTAFDGVVGKEPVRLRVEAWLTEVPRDLASRVQVHLVGRISENPVRWDAQGAVEGVWPSG